MQVGAETRKLLPSTPVMLATLPWHSRKQRVRSAIAG